MTPASPTFRYEAIASDGSIVAGTIQALSEPAGRERLRSLGLSIRQIERVVPPRTSPLNTDDLASFNDQLAQLARAGLPVEHGLRLLASDMSRGRLRRAVEAVLYDLERGQTLPQAIDAHRRAFPPLYANVVEAGIRANNLPAALFNLSRHLDLTRRVRNAVSRSVAYPAMVLLAVVVIAAFLSAYVLPTMATIVKETNTGGFAWSWGRSRWSPPPKLELPNITKAAIAFGNVAPYLAGVTVATFVGCVMIWPLVRGTSAGRWLVDSFISRVPLFGPPLRLSMIGRWCDALRIGVEAGLDLPQSFSLASQTIGSRRLLRDGAILTHAVETGARLDSSGPFSMLPIAVPAAVDIGSRSGTLSETLEALATLYLRQAETRASMIPLVLTPVLVLVMAVVLGALLTALFSPLTQLLRAMTG